jgi:hypothetical protein
MRDINIVRATGIIFWSKLDDHQSYTVLRLGVKLTSGQSFFCSVNNPSTKNYELIKAGNKVFISDGKLDLWVKENGEEEMQIKVNDSGIAFYPKDKALPDLNEVTIMGRVDSYEGDQATISMIGERNPKTDKPSVKKTKIKVGDALGSIMGSRIMLSGKLISTEVNGKSKVSVESNYASIMIL